MGGLRTWIEGVLYVSEDDADRQRWPSLSSLDRGPWTVDRGVGPFGRAVLSCAVRALGRWAGAVLLLVQCCGVDARGSRCRDEACCVAGGGGKSVGPVGSGSRSGSRSLRLRLRLRCGRCSRRCCCCSYRRDMRQSTRATVGNQQGGKRTTRGYQKKMSEDGRLIQNCATTGAAARVKLAR